MSRLDSLKEVKRGIGVTCQCGKSARLTFRSRTICYECFDREIRRIFANQAEQRVRDRIREIDRHLSNARSASPAPCSRRLMVLPDIETAH